MVRVIDLLKEYPTRGEPLVVLRGISLELAAGEALAVMGPSGSGKSTLLHILGTLERPTTGTVRIGDVEPFALSDRDLAAFRNRSIGFVFQDHHLLPQCSALENVLIPSLVRSGARTVTNRRFQAAGKPNHGKAGGLEPPVRLGNPEPDRAEDRARELLALVGLVNRLEHRPAELSGGERQRVAIARAFINRPTLILADEPTGNLDRKSAAAVADLFFELQRAEGAMMIVVTHSPELASRFPRRAELIDGRFES